MFVMLGLPLNGNLVQNYNHYNNNYFSSIQEGDKVNVRVIGQRFELNDKFISIIGELIVPNNPRVKVPDKPKLVIEN